jgi:hypothetical protein
MSFSTGAGQQPAPALLGLDGAVRHPPARVAAVVRRVPLGLGRRGTTCGRRSSSTSASPASSSPPWGRSQPPPSGGPPSPAWRSWSSSRSATGTTASRSVDGPVEFQAALRAGVGSAAVVALGSVAFAVPLPRIQVAVTVVLLTLGAAIGRHALRRVLHGRRSRGVAMSRTLVVGDATSVHHLIHDLRGATYHGYQVIGVCLPAITDQPPQDGSPRWARSPTSRRSRTTTSRRGHRVGQRAVGRRLRRLSWALGRAGCRPRRRPGPGRGARSARPPAAHGGPVAARGRDDVAASASCSPSRPSTARSVRRSSWQPRR